MEFERWQPLLSDQDTAEIQAQGDIECLPFQLWLRLPHWSSEVRKGIQPSAMGLVKEPLFDGIPEVLADHVLCWPFRAATPGALQPICLTPKFATKFSDLILL